MNRVGRVFRDNVDFIFNEIILGQHLNVRVVCVDTNWTTKGYGDRAVSGEQSPPNSLPQPLVRFGKLRCLDAVNVRQRNHYSETEGQTFGACQTLAPPHLQL